MIFHDSNFNFGADTFLLNSSEGLDIIFVDDEKSLAIWA